jgi:PIN domain nuclease of toxin-antitoxin system
MKLLLDTQVLLMAAIDDPKLSDDAKSLIGDSGNEVFFSSASIWELVLKKNRSPVDPAQFRLALLDNNYQELPITAQHSTLVRLLPKIHEEPFSRIMIAQASGEDMFLISQDPVVLEYPSVLSATHLKMKFW